MHDETHARTHTHIPRLSNSTSDSLWKKCFIVFRKQVTTRFVNEVNIILVWFGDGKTCIFESVSNGLLVLVQQTNNGIGNGTPLKVTFVTN